MELKPCPFCGSEFIKIAEEQDWMLNRYFYAMCAKCLCQTKRCNEAKSAIEEWNRRVNE